MNFAIKALLTVAVAFGLAAMVPAHAMETSVTADVNTQVAAKTGLFSGLSKKALQDRLNSTMKTLNKQWASFMKCAKGKGCTFSQKALIVASLTTILAIVTLLGGHQIAQRATSERVRNIADAPYLYATSVPAATRAGAKYLSEKATAAKKYLGEKFDYRPDIKPSL